MTSFIAPDLFKPSPAAWPFGALQPQAYDLIMADPAWPMELYSESGEAKSPQAHYETMSFEEIAGLPVADLAREDCLLWLWGTGALLDRQIGVLKAWGFRFVTSGVWVKTTVTGKLNFGTGYVLRNCHEPFLLGALGEPIKRPKTARPGVAFSARNVRSALMAPAREHSRKPDAAYAMAEALMPGTRRADLFSRESRPGWEAWGNECGKFDAGVAARAAGFPEGSRPRQSKRRAA